MEGSAIVVHEQNTFLEPAATIAKLRERYQIFNQFVKEVLRPGTDFAAVPGSDKPSLMKPGAEKLTALFGLSSRFTAIESIEDWTGENIGEPFFYYKYRCELYRGDLFVTSCDGSCNSWEKKYRYRENKRVCPTCGKPAIIRGKKEYGGGWLCFAKNGGCGAKFKDGDQSVEGQTTGLVPNADIADQVNTLQKMAQKRAFVGAVLIATNASEYFTQDIEDMPGFGGNVVDGQFTVEPKPAPQPATQPVHDYAWACTIKTEKGTLLETLTADQLTLLIEQTRHADIKEAAGIIIEHRIAETANQPALPV
jgi:hypothetical protein